MGKVIVGQEDLIEALLLALLCNGHVLIEGIPGLAKTLAVTTLAQTLHAGFNRIQFTPDLLPGDLIGTMMYTIMFFITHINEAVVSTPVIRMNDTVRIDFPADYCL